MMPMLRNRAREDFDDTTITAPFEFAFFHQNLSPADISFPPTHKRKGYLH
jgi:hypothetical protein